ncbi:MAG TPA: cytochrome ubiquinol oxidase subunit I [Ktedonobacterales bacterium]
MTALLLSRWQFGITTVYHFFFVPLTLGLALLIAVMETVYVRTGEDVYKRMAQFWGRLFLINFAMGVVTGIVQEFQFGMNWADYSRFVGDIFGAPLAIEALAAFFLESTFLGIWMFGWNRLSKRLHLATIWLVAIASNLSAFWILVANSFMQQPVGYTLRHGRAEMTDFFALISNPNVLVQFPHVFFAGLTTGAFFILGVSAWRLLREKDGNIKAFFTRSFNLAIPFAVAASLLVMLVGHTQAQHMVRVQPMKMAAAEALYTTADPAPFSVLTIGDLHGREVFSIRIPDVLSLLSYNSLTGKVEGIDQLQQQYVQEYGPGNYIPPVPVIYWSFRLMVGAGILMLLLAIYGAYTAARNLTPTRRRFLYLMLGGLFLPYLANSTGWLMTEMGRQPWIVFGLLKTASGVSPSVGSGMVLTSLIAYTVVYGALMVVDVYLLGKYSAEPPVAREGATAEVEEPELVEMY